MPTPPFTISAPVFVDVDVVTFAIIAFPLLVIYKFPFIFKLPPTPTPLDTTIDPLVYVKDG